MPPRVDILVGEIFSCVILEGELCMEKFEFFARETTYMCICYTRIQYSIHSEQPVTHSLTSWPELSVIVHWQHKLLRTQHESLMSNTQPSRLCVGHCEWRQYSHHYASIARTNVTISWSTPCTFILFVCLFVCLFVWRHKTRIVKLLGLHPPPLLNYPRTVLLIVLQRHS